MSRGRIPEKINRAKRSKSVDSHDADHFQIDKVHLGERLRAERTRIHKTQEDIAEAVGITPAFLGHIERGERSLSLDKLIRLSHLYGVTIDYLLSDTLSPHSNSIGSQIDDLLSDKTNQQKTAFMDIMQAVIRNL